MSLLIKKSRPPEQKINKGQNRALAVDRLWGAIFERIWRPSSIWEKRENVLHVGENARSVQKIIKIDLPPGTCFAFFRKNEP